VAVKTPDIQRLMQERSRALAAMYLTRRKGVKVQDAAGGVGIDLLFTFPGGNKRGVRQLGVELKYALDPVPHEDPNSFLASSWRDLVSVGPFPFPVVAFFFTMRDDKGWYAWIAEPVITSDGRAQLPLSIRPDCHFLTDESLEALLDSVNLWYDAHYEGLTSALSGKKRGKRS
jgi:hypothetical protein